MLVVLFVFVARPGFEPRQTEPKSVVLPLYYRAILNQKTSPEGDRKYRSLLYNLQVHF